MVIGTTQMGHVMDSLNNGTGNQIINILFDTIAWPLVVQNIYAYH